MAGGTYDIGGERDKDISIESEKEQVPGSCCRHLWIWKNFIIILATPIILSVLPIYVGTSESRCAYVVLVMAVYWFTEAIPVAVTALLPIPLFPLLGILEVDVTCKSYMKDTNVLFLGGMVVAITIEYWNLHRRIALRIIMLVGSEPRWVMLGVMLATWFLSMWISNTATTAMMVPITEAILQQLEGTNSRKRSKPNSDQERKSTNSVDKSREMELSVISTSTSDAHNGTDIQIKDNDEDYEENKRKQAEFERLGKGLSLSVCYSAACGGIASLTGTGPNLILKENSDELYSGSSLSNPVTFGSWLAFGIPMSIVVLIVVWLWMQAYYLGRRGIRCCGKTENEDPEAGKRVKKLIKYEYQSLGPITFGQGLVFASFVTLVFLWVTRDMGGKAGWNQWFDLKISDSVPAISVAILLFMLPSTFPCVKSYRRYSHPKRLQDGQSQHGQKFTIHPLMNWETVNKRMPWSLLFLLGGGFALSSGFDKSGLSDWVGNQLDFVRDWNEWATLLMVCYISAACTEITSNTAMSSVLLPIMRRLAGKVGAHPLSYMFPVCLSTSFAFMLPVATPPNAIVFAYGRIKITEMAKAGFMLNILAVPCVVFMTQILGPSIFDFDQLPSEFPIQNATDLLNSVSA